MKKFIGHTAVFLLLYIGLMIPTYLLPYLGSNSSMLNAAAISSGVVNPAFLIHLFILILLIALAFFRGANISKVWLIVFPILALVFDLVPILSSIPLVPTIMHLLAIILGVAGTNINTEMVTQVKEGV